MTLPTAVVIPTLNEADTIVTSFRGLASQARPVDYVILMDGGSTDGTVERARELADRHGLTLYVGQEEGANIGVSCAAGIYKAGEYFKANGGDGVVVRTDADSVLADDWVEAAVAALEEPGVTLFGSKTLPFYKVASQKPRADERLSRRAFSAISNVNKNPKGRGMAFLWSDFDEVNGFCICEGRECDCAPEWYEDAVIAEKLKTVGDIAWSNETVVFSEMPSTTISSPGRWRQHQNWRQKVREMEWHPSIDM